MTLIKCPGCNHTISSVASKCPQCGTLLSQFRFVQGQGGGLTECRRCARKVLSGAKTCPYCGIARPGRRAPYALLALVGALTIPLLVVAALRTRAPQALFSAAEAISEPPVPQAASLAQATPPAEASVPQAEPAIPAPAPTDSVATQTKWTLDWVNVREGRAVEATVVRVLRPGSAVQVADRQMGWWELHMGGRVIGYVAGSVLGDQPPPTPPDTTAGGHD